MRPVRVLPLLLLAFALPVEAQVPGAPADARPEGVQWAVGLGVVGSPRPYTDADTSFMPVPIFSVRAGRFYFDTVRMGVRAVDVEHFEMDVLARARFDGHEPDDSPALEGMEERRMSADAGIRLLGKTDHFEADLTAVTDVLSRNDGQEVALVLGFPFEAGGWSITPAVGAEWQSSNLADYYYGVEPSEARAGRPAYEVGETLNPRVEMRFRRFFAERRWLFFATLSQEWLDQEIRDSPIVDRSSTLGGFIGFTRNFGGGRPR